MIKTVVVTDCMYRSAIAVIYSLKRLGEEIIAVTTDANPKPPAFYSKYIKNRYVFSSEREEYCQQLIELCKKNETPVIFPVGVFTLNIIAENKALFEKVSYFAVSEKSILDRLNDKKESKKIAKSAGIRVPEKTDSFPMVVKPFCGEKFGLKASERYRIVHSQKELADAVEFFSEYDSEPICEEYISGCGVGVSVVIGNDGKERTAFCHKRLSEYPANGGPSSSLIAFKDNRLIQQTVKMLKEADFVGIAMAEYKMMSTGEYCFLEINPRIWGSFGATYKCNSDFVGAYLSAARGTEYEFAPKYKARKVKFVPNIFASVISYSKCGRLGAALKTLVDAINPFVPNAIFSIKDPMPSIMDIFRKRR